MRNEGAELSGMDYKILEKYCMISKNGVNEKWFTLVSWGGHLPVFDLRKWHNDTVPGPYSGIKLDLAELRTLKKAIDKVLDKIPDAPIE